jgi:hypothetical protein
MPYRSGRTTNVSGALNEAGGGFTKQLPTARPLLRVGSFQQGCPLFTKDLAEAQTQQQGRQLLDESCEIVEINIALANVIISQVI